MCRPNSTSKHYKENEVFIKTLNIKKNPIYSNLTKVLFVPLLKLPTIKLYGKKLPFFLFSLKPNKAFCRRNYWTFLKISIYVSLLFSYLVLYIIYSEFHKHKVNPPRAEIAR